MNIAKALDAAQGRTKETPRSEASSAVTNAVRLKHIEWLQQPETIDLLQFLEAKRMQYILDAEGATDQLITDLKIRKSLAKATTLKEVIEYARRDPTE